MSVTISKANYPALQNANGVGVSGKQSLIYINYGTGDGGAAATENAPVWNLLGGLKSHSIAYSAEINDTQTASSGFWSEGVVVGKSCEISAEVVLKRDNTAQAILTAYFEDDDITTEKGAINFAIVDKETKDYIKFWAIPTSWEKTCDVGDVISMSLSATVINGAPTKATNFTV